jgi:hypothetical protein
VDYVGHITKCGDAFLRSHLFEAAKVLLCRSPKTDNFLKSWGLNVARRSSMKKACAAVARRPGVNLPTPSMPLSRGRSLIAFRLSKVQAENSHQPTRRREHKMQGFKSPGSAQEFSQRTQPLTTLSTSNVISPQQERTEPSGPRRSRRGTKSSLRRELNMPADLLRALFGNVTVPCAIISMSSYGAQLK